MNAKSVEIVMDSKSIKKCLTGTSKGYTFPGSLKYLGSVADFKRVTNFKNGDCYVLNTGGPSGQHWFCVLILYGTCFLFDCSLMTEDSYHTKALQSFTTIPTSLQIAQLQGVDTLTCGEHCITFLCNVVNASTYTKEEIKKLDYANALRQVAAELKESCDQYVTDFVYKTHLFDIEKPPLPAVSKWLTGNNI